MRLVCLPVADESLDATGWEEAAACCWGSPGSSRKNSPAVSDREAVTGAFSSVKLSAAVTSAFAPGRQKAPNKSPSEREKELLEKLISALRFPYFQFGCKLVRFSRWISLG